LSHDPFYGYCINNFNTIKSCILDNSRNEIYFTYGEHNSAKNKYLKYSVETGDVEVYKEKQEVADNASYEAALDYSAWYKKTFARKKKLTESDYKIIIDYVQPSNLNPAFKSYLLSGFYSNLKDNENSFIQAENYISEMPDFSHSYYNKYKVMRDMGEYMKAIVALEEMLQTSTINPYYEYRAKISMIEMYDKLLENKYDSVYIDKIHKLYSQINTDIIQYFVDTETQKDLDLIEKINKKYK